MTHWQLELSPGGNIYTMKISKCYKSALRTIAQEKENQESKESHKIEETEISVWGNCGS